MGRVLFGDASKQADQIQATRRRLRKSLQPEDGRTDLEENVVEAASPATVPRIIEEDREFTLSPPFGGRERVTAGVASAMEDGDDPAELRSRLNGDYAEAIDAYATLERRLEAKKRDKAPKPASIPSITAPNPRHCAISPMMARVETKMASPITGATLASAPRSRAKPAARLRKTRRVCSLSETP